MWLEKVASKHKDWVRVVKSFGAKDNAEDIVQNMYITLTELEDRKLNPNDGRENIDYIDKPTCERVLNKDGEVNVLYIWIYLKRSFMEEVKGEAKRGHVNIDEVKQIKSELDILTHKEKLLNSIEDEIDTWDWYDKMLFNIYRTENKSMRKLAEDTGISLANIFYTLKRCKNKLKENVGEEWEDFNNKDYELLK